MVWESGKRWKWLFAAGLLAATVSLVLRVARRHG